MATYVEVVVVVVMEQELATTFAAAAAAAEEEATAEMTDPTAGRPSRDLMNDRMILRTVLRTIW